MPINPRPMLQNLYVFSQLPISLSSIFQDITSDLLGNRGRIIADNLNSYSVNEEVIIRLKWGQTEYKGRLVSIDSYMNIQLSGAEEWIDQQMTSALGQVLIRYVTG